MENFIFCTMQNTCRQPHFFVTIFFKEFSDLFVILSKNYKNWHFQGILLASPSIWKLLEHLKVCHENCPRVKSLIFSRKSEKLCSHMVQELILLIYLFSMPYIFPLIMTPGFCLELNRKEYRLRFITSVLFLLLVYYSLNLLLNFLIPMQHSNAELNFITVLHTHTHTHTHTRRQH